LPPLLGTGLSPLSPTSSFLFFPSVCSSQLIFTVFIKLRFAPPTSEAGFTTTQPGQKSEQASIMMDFRSHGLVLGLIIFIALAQPAAAFGAGNIASISKIEGQNC
jgi:hypothetical protein